MTGIFISYRREDAAAYAGRLRDRLVTEFGENQVFMDVETIDLGVDFTEVIDKAVSEVNVLLCIIGPEWSSVRNSEGIRRLEDSADFVRLEVATALKRNIRVVPVLVKNASMPSMDELPSDLAALSKRNALQVEDSRFHADVDRLVQSIRSLYSEIHIGQEKSLDDLTKIDPSPTSIRATQDKPKSWRILGWIAAGFILCFGVGGAWYFWKDRLGNQPPGQLEEESPETAAYEKALALNTLQTFQAYQEKYPDGKHSIEVRSKINTLIQQHQGLADKKLGRPPKKQIPFPSIRIINRITPRGSISRNPQIV